MTTSKLAPCRRARLVLASLILLLGALLLGALQASATPPSQGLVSRGMDHWGARALGLEMGLSLGGPSGLLGAGLDVTPAAFFSITAGVGVSQGGLQVSLMPRFRLPLGHHGIYVGSGVSYGGGHIKAFLTERVDQVEGAVWLNNELGYEYLAAGGFTARAFLGWAMSVYESDCRFDGYRGWFSARIEGGSCEAPHMTPYLGVALGYRFP